MNQVSVGIDTCIQTEITTEQSEVSFDRNVRSNGDVSRVASLADGQTGQRSTKCGPSCIQSGGKTRVEWLKEQRSGPDIAGRRETELISPQSQRTIHRRGTGVRVNSGQHQFAAALLHQISRARNHSRE